MHAENCYSAVYYLHAVVSAELCNCSASTYVDLSHFSHLILYAVLFKDTSDFSYELRICI